LAGALEEDESGWRERLDTALPILLAWAGDHGRATVELHT